MPTKELRSKCFDCGRKIIRSRLRRLEWDRNHHGFSWICVKCDPQCSVPPGSTDTILTYASTGSNFTQLEIPMFEKQNNTPLTLEFPVREKPPIPINFPDTESWEIAFDDWFRRNP